MFDDILDKDEIIEKTFKPDKTKFWTSAMLSTLFVAFWVLFVALIVPICDEETPVTWVNFLIAFGSFAAIFLISILFNSLYYNKILYAYTNKRILIKTGIIGVDYKSLDMKMIGAVDVYTSFIDKLLKRKTGSIKFGSMASPMSNGSVPSYSFNHILNAYETYREIKENIEERKKQA